MKVFKALQVLYGLVAYFMFLAVLVYATGFINGWFVPHHIDNNIPGEGLWGFVINAGILTIFAIQHTIMARPGFKKWWTKIIPSSIERSTFVIIANSIFVVLFLQWRSYTGVVWEIETPILKYAVHGIALFGYGIAVYATFLIDHFGLFGLKQVWADFRGKKVEDPDFKTPWLYTKVRNPLMLGFLVGFWATPLMTAGHLFFAIMVTGYVLIGVRIEERDIAKNLGAPYINYRAKTPMLIPNIFKLHQ